MARLTGVSMWFIYPCYETPTSHQSNSGGGSVNSSLPHSLQTPSSSTLKSLCHNMSHVPGEVELGSLLTNDCAVTNTTHHMTIWSDTWNLPQSQIQHTGNCSSLHNLVPQSIQNLDIMETSLVVHWLRVCLPMQGTQVPSLKDPCALEHLSLGATTTEPMCTIIHWNPSFLEPMLCNERAHHSGKPVHCN